ADPPALPGAGAGRRGSGRHRAGRALPLQAARAELGAILETEVLPATARARLQAVDRRLRDAEAEAHEAEEHRGRWLTQQWRQLLTRAGGDEGSDAKQANMEELASG
ncbi:unnamed protein product, partial [Prorocentrum cordatum]